MSKLLDRDPVPVRRRRAAAWSIAVGLAVAAAVAPLLMLAGFGAWVEFTDTGFWAYRRIRIRWPVSPGPPRCSF